MNSSLRIRPLARHFDVIVNGVAERRGHLAARHMLPFVFRSLIVLSLARERERERERERGLWLCYATRGVVVKNVITGEAGAECDTRRRVWRDNEKRAENATEVKKVARNATKRSRGAEFTDGVRICTCVFWLWSS